jgi:hypothetical protein
VSDKSENIGERRRSIFVNIATGIPLADVMVANKMSELEVTNELKFVLRKIRERRAKKLTRGGTVGKPYADRVIACDVYSDILQHGKAMLVTLSEIGNETLSSELFLYRKILTQKIDSEDALREIDHRAKTA